MPKRNSLFTLIITLAALSAVALSAVTLHAQARASARPIAIAVVDVQKAFNELDRRRQVEAEITARTEQLQAEAQTKQAGIRTRMADIELALDANTEAYRQETQKLESDTIEFNTWRQFQLRKLEMEKALQLENLYKSLTQTIQRTAEREGYGLVIQKDDTLSVTQRDQQALTAMIVQRKVLYVSPTVDITDLVIQQANNEYNNR